MEVHCSRQGFLIQMNSFIKLIWLATEKLVGKLPLVKNNFGKGKTNYYVASDVDAELVKGIS